MALVKQGNVDQQLYGAGVGQVKLMEMLQSLPPLAPEDNAGLLARLERYHPDPILSADECLILSFVDGCMREILNRASLDPQLERLILRFAPHVALVAVGKGPAKLFDTSPVFGLIDQLCKFCIGWSSDLGVLGELSIEKVTDLVEEVSFDPKVQRTKLKKLKQLFKKEHKIFADREAQFKRDEIRELESAGARDRVARIINREMEGNHFSFFMIILLQGEWLNFVQSVLLAKGPKSNEWTAAQNLTKSLIWSLKDHTSASAKQRDKLRDIITSLPSKARALEKRAGVGGSRAKNAMIDVEDEYQAILQGDPPERGEFTPIEMYEFNTGTFSPSSMLTRNRIEAAPGEWFLYEELDRESSRLKLILSWQNKQLLFTNHNHKGAIPIGYMDFCRSYTAGIIRRLPPVPSCNTIVKNYVEQLLKKQQQTKAEGTKRKNEATEKRKKVMAERRKKDEAERRKKVAADRLQKAELDRLRKAEALRLQQAELDKLRRAEAKRLKKEGAERRKQAAAEKRKKAKADRLQKAELDRLRKAEAKRLKKEEAERRKQAAADKRKKAEADKLKKAEADKRKKEEADKRRKADADKRRKAEADKRKKEDADKRRKADADKRKQEESDKRKQAEADKRKQADADKRRKADADKRKQAEADKRKQADADKRRKEEADKRRKADADKRRKEEADQRRKADADKRKQAEADKRKQAEAARTQKQATKSQPVDKTMPIAEEVIDDAIAAISGLGLGAKILLESAEGEVVVCKLLTKIANIGRYIFVDRGGIKVAQHNQEELVQLYLDRKLEILTRGEEFEDTLATVVRGLREDRDKTMAEEEA
jgi:colicin import membrane protein